MSRSRAKIEKDLETFRQLWDGGIRFIQPDDNNINTGISREKSPGVYEVLTMKGLKAHAAAGKLTLDGFKLTEEDVELMFNLMGFIVKVKNNQFIK